MTLLTRLLRSLVLFLLLLSVALNGFFLLTRPVIVTGETVQTLSTISGSGTSALPPLAFGVIVRPLPLERQTVDASGASVKPIASYSSIDALLPVLPPELPVYRDQGVLPDDRAMSSFFARAKIPFDPLKLQLQPESSTFLSADGTIRVSVSLPLRQVTIERTSSLPSLALSSPADDAEVKAIADTFTGTLGIDTSSLGEAHVVQTKASKDQAGKTIVVRNLQIAGVPVVDKRGAPIRALSVVVGRLSHRAISASLSLFTPDTLASSTYPLASPALISAAFASGGLLPFPVDPKGGIAQYRSAAIAYMLVAKDAQFPAYLIPVVMASFSSDTGISSAMTLVPLVDPTKFVWSAK